MQVDTNIQNNLTTDEKEIFSIIRKVIESSTPSTIAYAVGGWVRDKLISTPSDDIDIMLSNISGEDFAKLITKYLNIKDPHIIRENPEKSKHITTAKAYIPLSSGKIQEIDFAQARSEVYKEDSRIPEIKPATPEEDAYRRDLTINSIFYNINRGQLEDFTGKGIKDLLTGTIRTPTNALKTFSDDPLRVLRVVRFLAKYNGKIDSETYKAMMDPDIRNEIKQKISKERIGVEITKMLKNPNAEYAIQLLKDTGLWQDIITESLKSTEYEGKMSPLEMEQQNTHHKLNLWEHTFQVIKNILSKYQEAEPEKRITMILSALTHDLGKLYQSIQSPAKNHPGNISYHGHEKESKEIAQYILKYLKMEPYIQQVTALAQHHMRPHEFTEGDVHLRSMRRFIRQMGEQSLDWLDVFNLALADAQAKDVSIDPKISQQYEELKIKLEEALTSMGTPKTEIKPILNGNEIMEILNVKPGPWMKEIMDFVKELKDENPNITKEDAANLLREKYKDFNAPEIKKANNTTKKEEEKEPLSLCPFHLFRSKNEEINKLLKEGRYYEVATILRQLKKEYKDEKVLRLIALNMFKLLIIDEKYRDNNILQSIFDHAQNNFFDEILCSFVVGILMLIDTDTDDKIILEVGNRMIKMSPGTMKTMLNMLPENISRPEIKKEFEKNLK